MDRNRRTGRTTRMLQAALAKAGQGKTVLVVGPTYDFVRMLADRFMQFDGVDRRSIYRFLVDGGGTVEFVSARGHRGFAGYDREHTHVFVDHATLGMLPLHDHLELMHALERF